ncbi:histidine kinase dimerization/phosphoacceptor domain -containing protein [Chelatococcus asaccharovorans]|uniref:Histidine kinase n=1 Tax=Chelatococcus asaccharovorans TaxID=28210 RepID=A0A2V3TXK6_9HYPH|nr:histidine kinase dimerization/phosphoacceptor domain -containing protein [Chelatococcus asaccharovorans]MBS7704629.1 sensor histidine kinase [Chelatococcus asaccharovorans]PXW54530.1 histidine kinase [Chelatococcus asaccharovorans]
MTFGHSLRSRIVITLGFVLLPAVILAFVWIFTNVNALREAKVANAERAASAMALQVNESLRDMVLASVGLDANRGGGQSAATCDRELSAIVGAQASYVGGAVIDAGRVSCALGASAADFERLASPERLARIHAGLATGAPLVLELLTDAEAGHSLEASGLSVASDGYLLAAFPGSRSTDELFLVLLTKARITTDLATHFMDIAHGAALFGPDGTILAEWRADSLPQRWLPAMPLGSAADKGTSISGDSFRYFKIPLARTGLVLLVGYPEDVFFASEQNILWVTLLPPVLMLGAAAVGALLAVDRLVIQWIVYLQRVTRVYGSGRYSVRALRLSQAPRELGELGYAFNHMADNIAHHATELSSAIEDKERLLRELHHRVKNNFQVIVSLLSLHKQSLPVQERDDIRFIEDHVNAMAVAYRVGYSYGEMGDAPVAELLHDIVDGLRRTADLAPAHVVVEVPPVSTRIDLDRAIGIGLYLAAMLPAYLDMVRADAHSASSPMKVRVGAVVEGDSLRLAVSIRPAESAVQLSHLRSRLTRAYIRQLSAREVSSDDMTERAIAIPLDADDREGGPVGARPAMGFRISGRQA